MCLESVSRGDGACETSWCENGGQPIVGHALLEGIMLDSAGDECVVIESVDHGPRTRFRRRELHNESRRKSGSVVLIPETKPSQLPRHTLLPAEESSLEGLNAAGFKALTIQD
jgi:hypothetical protein